MRASLLSESVAMGLGGLREHAFRTVLSTTGVIIGVAALVAAFAVTDGVDRWSRWLIERESSVQDVVVESRVHAEDGTEPARLHDVPVLTRRDWEAARAEIGGVRGAVLTLAGPAWIRYQGRTRAVRLTLSTADLSSASALPLLAGRFYTAPEVSHGRAVVVLGYRLAADLARPRDPRTLLGRQVRVGAQVAQVAGVLQRHPDETDLYAFAPLTVSAGGVFGSSVALYPSLRIKAASVESVRAVRDATEQWLAQRFGQGWTNLVVSVGVERLERTEQGILLTKLLLGFLVTLMLAIGGIGIMNVLLASVGERTREIGIRKSVGARGQEIFVQFLTESLAIAALGSALGVAMGVVLAGLGTAVFRHFTQAGIYAVYRPTTAALVVLSAAAVGTVFGTYPALRAARLSPVEAMTRE